MSLPRCVSERPSAVATGTGNDCRVAPIFSLPLVGSKLQHSAGRAKFVSPDTVNTDYHSAVQNSCQGAACLQCGQQTAVTSLANNPPQQQQQQQPVSLMSFRCQYFNMGKMRTAQGAVPMVAKATTNVFRIAPGMFTQPYSSTPQPALVFFQDPDAEPPKSNAEISALKSSSVTMDTVSRYNGARYPLLFSSFT